MVCSKGEQGDVTCALDGDGNSTLMSGTGASLTTRADLAVTGYELTQHVNVLIVDVLDVLLAKAAAIAAITTRASTPST